MSNHNIRCKVCFSTTQLISIETGDILFIKIQIFMDDENHRDETFRLILTPLMHFCTEKGQISEEGLFSGLYRREPVHFRKAYR